MYNKYLFSFGFKPVCAFFIIYIETYTKLRKIKHKNLEDFISPEN